MLLLQACLCLHVVAVKLQPAAELNPLQNWGLPFCEFFFGGAGPLPFLLPLWPEPAPGCAKVLLSSWYPSYLGILVPSGVEEYGSLPVWKASLLMLQIQFDMASSIFR